MALEYVRSLFVSVLQKLGFLDREATIVLLGLDNAGKTTLQWKLKTGSLQLFVPTQRAKEEEFQIGGITFKAWDLGGHKAARHLWKKFSAMADGIVFMCDASDPGRMEEARAELHLILDDERTRGTPLVVMANKCDADGALDRQALQLALDIDDQCQLYRTSVVQDIGYTDAFRWLADSIPS